MQAFGNQGKSVARIKINFAEELTNDWSLLLIF
jgi:hypothetical protein